MQLNCINLCKKYNNKFVVNEIALSLETKKVTGLLGPNGAGKTTTFYMLVGLIKSNSGEIHLDNKEITELPMHLRSDLGISYLPQEPSIFRNLNVKDNILAILETRKNLSSKEQLSKLDFLISTLQIEDILENNGASLSGGERRRVEIARALATEPKFLLLDEPFAGIDPISVIEIQKIIKELIKSDIGVLITDHNVQETLSITDRAYLLFEGNILKSGTAEELASDPTVRKVYLGEHFELKKTIKK